MLLAVPAAVKAPAYGFGAAAQRCQRAAEVPINLERRMIVEQIRMRRTGKQRLNKMMRLLRLAQPCIQVNEPCAAPARMAAATCNPLSQRFPSSLRCNTGFFSD